MKIATQVIIAPKNPWYYSSKWDEKVIESSALKCVKFYSMETKKKLNLPKTKMKF